MAERFTRSKSPEGLENKEGQSAIGSIRCLLRTPSALVFIGAIAFSMGTIALIRLGSEGRYYDYSLASAPGDTLLAAYLALASRMLKSEEGWQQCNLLKSRSWDISVASTWILLGTGLALRKPFSGDELDSPANLYHNLFVVPGLGYMISSSLPLLFLRRKTATRAVGLICLLGWCALLAIDISYGNLEKNSP